MKEFSSGEFRLDRALLGGLSLAESDYIVEVDDDKLTIRNIASSEEVILSFDKQSYDEEINQIRRVDDYLIIGDDFLNVVLLDPFNQLKEITDQIVIDGPHKGTIMREPYYGLLFTSLKKISRQLQWSELQLLDSPIQFSQLLRDNILVLEIKDLNEHQLSDSAFVARLIASMLGHLSFKNEVLLESAKDYYIHSPGSISEPFSSEYILAEDLAPMLYFLSAEKISYPHLKYLEYYHVIEYFFLESSIARIEEIISELFLLKMGKKVVGGHGEYYKGLVSLYNLFGKKERVTEEEQIKIVFSEILGFNSLKSCLVSPGIDLKFLTKKLFDDHSTKIDLTKIIGSNNTWHDNPGEADKQLFCSAIANRIYRIRNFIVHTKKGERDDVFMPELKYFSLLNDDLKFIRILSFRILLERSRPTL